MWYVLTSVLVSLICFVAGWWVRGIVDYREYEERDSGDLDDDETDAR